VNPSDTTADAGSAREAAARLVRVRGRVQGVGFRETCVATARALGVAGWVRNRHDGSVEALLVGAPARLDALQRWLADGPPAARVDSVAVETVAPPDPLPAAFERGPTG
jgi:acylphosphatase